jgi:hypothetical protein
VAPRDCFGALLEARSAEGAILRYILFGAPEILRTLYLARGDEVTLLDHITRSPDEATGCDFGVGFVSIQFNVPSDAPAIRHLNLFLCPALVLFLKGEGRLRHLVRRADAPIEIKRRNVAALRPEDGRACLGRRVGGEFRGLLVLPFFLSLLVLLYLLWRERG